jgi:hypothetical protein
MKNTLSRTEPGSKGRLRAPLVGSTPQLGAANAKREQPRGTRRPRAARGGGQRGRGRPRGARRRPGLGWPEDKTCGMAQSHRKRRPRAALAESRHASLIVSLRFSKDAISQPELIRKGVTPTRAESRPQNNSTTHAVEKIPSLGRSQTANAASGLRWSEEHRRRVQQPRGGSNRAAHAG